MRQIDKKAFGRRVSARIEKLGITQRRLGKSLGVSQQTIQNVCAGIVARPRFIDELANALGTTKAWLWYAEGPEVVLQPSQRETALALLAEADEMHVGAVIELLQTLRNAKRRSA